MLSLWKHPLFYLLIVLNLSASERNGYLEQTIGSSANTRA